MNIVAFIEQFVRTHTIIMQVWNVCVVCAARASNAVAHAHRDNHSNLKKPINHSLPLAPFPATALFPPPYHHQSHSPRTPSPQQTGRKKESRKGKKEALGEERGCGEKRREYGTLFYTQQYIDTHRYTQSGGNGKSSLSTSRRLLPHNPFPPTHPPSPLHP